ncbi:MAG: glycosyltransferase family 4 protein [Planctomycetota bacterium]
MAKILYLDTSTGYGGAPRCLFDLIGNLDRTRFDPIVAAARMDGFIREIEKGGTPVIPLPGGVGDDAGSIPGQALHFLRKSLPAALAIRRLIRTHQIHLVHLNNEIYSSVPAILGARMARRPVVCHLRLWRAPTRLEKAMGRLVDHFIVLSHASLKFYQPFWPGKPMTVLYDPAPPPVPAPAGTRERIRTEWGIPARAPLVGLISRCAPGKGFAEFIRAVAQVLREIPEARFLIAGNGSGGEPAVETAARALARDLKLDNALIWAGWRDTNPVYPALDVVVQPSTRPEGLSHVILESMAYGIPVVATAHPTSVEALGNGAAGLLVPPGDVGAMAAAILQILNDPSLAATLGQAGKERAATVFSPSVHIASLQRLYDGLKE